MVPDREAVAVDFNAPAAGLRFDDITTLEALDGSGKALTPVSEEQLAPASIGLLATFEAGYRRGSGPCGKGTKFFLFDPGTVNACEKGGLSVYGLGRFPVTLYKEQWAKLLDYADELKTFLKDNDHLLKAKE